MRCPRCSEELVTYSLLDRTAVTCEACGYADVATDHTPAPSTQESWDAALQRFNAHRAETSETVSIGESTYRVSTDVAAEIEQLTAKQRAVLAEVLRESDPAAPDRTRRDIADAAEVHPSYVSKLTRSFGELLSVLDSCRVE